MGCFRVYDSNFLSDTYLANSDFSSEDASYPASNAYNGQRRTKVWRSTGCASEWLEWDLGVPSSPKAFVMISNRNEPLKISPTATVKLQGNSTNNWTTQEVSVTLTVNDNIIHYSNSDGIHTSALRYWRILFEDSANPLGYIEAGFFFLGDWIETDRGVVVYPLASDYVDRSSIVFSEQGQSFAERRPLTEKFNVEWQILTKADYETLRNFWNQTGQHTPFFIEMDPNESFTTDNAFSVKYVKFDTPPRAELGSFNNWSMSWLLREEL